jgi:hypothetical protein
MLPDVVVVLLSVGLRDDGVNDQHDVHTVGHVA